MITGAQFVEAAWDGDSTTVKQYILSKADINFQNRDGFTALNRAAANGFTEIVRMLLDAGAQPDIQSKNGWTALSRAADKGRTEVVRMLLDAGAQPDIQDGSGRTALYQAAEWGNTEVVRMLLDARAQVDIQDKNGSTALYQAADNGRTEVVRMLLDAGAQPDIRNKDGLTALYWATHKGRTEVVRMLLDAGAQPDIQDGSGRTALYGAAEIGQTDFVRMLLDAGAQPDIQDRNGITALDVTKKEEIKTMLRNAQVKIRNDEPRTSQSQAKASPSKLTHKYANNSTATGKSGNTSVSAAATTKTSAPAAATTKTSPPATTTTKTSAPAADTTATRHDDDTAVITSGAVIRSDVESGGIPRADSLASDIDDVSILIGSSSSDAGAGGVGFIDDDLRQEIEDLTEDLISKVHLQKSAARRVADHLVKEEEVGTLDAMQYLHESGNLMSLLSGTASLKLKPVSLGLIEKYFERVRLGGGGGGAGDSFDALPGQSSAESTYSTASYSAKSYSGPLSPPFASSTPQQQPQQHMGGTVLPSATCRLIVSEQITEQGSSGVVSSGNSTICNARYLRKDFMGNITDTPVDAIAKLFSLDRHSLAEKEFRLLLELHNECPGVFVRPYEVMEANQMHIDRDQSHNNNDNNNTAPPAEAASNTLVNSSDCVALVMEKGIESLESYLCRQQQKPQHFKPQHKCAIIARVVDMLQAAHAHRIVLMDLKPSNIVRFVDPQFQDDIWKGIDLDGALHFGDKLQQSSFMGTPEYLPPELFGTLSDTVAADFRMDIWALGVLTLKVFSSVDSPGMSFWEQLLNTSDAKIIATEVQAPDKMQSKVDDLICRTFHGNEYSALRHFLLKVLKVRMSERIFAHTIRELSFIKGYGSSSINGSQLMRGQAQLSNQMSNLAKDFQAIHYLLSSHTALLKDILYNENNVPSLPLLLPFERVKLAERLNPKRMFQNKYRLYFLCPITLKRAGEGYIVKCPKMWFIKVAPALAIALSVLKTVAVAMNIPMPIPPGIVDGLLNVTDHVTFLNDYQKVLQDYVTSNDATDTVKDAAKDAAVEKFNQVHTALSEAENTGLERADQVKALDSSNLATAYHELFMLVAQLEGAPQPTPVNWKPKKTGLKFVISEAQNGGAAWVSSEAEEEFKLHGKAAFK